MPATQCFQGLGRGHNFGGQTWLEKALLICAAYTV